MILATKLRHWATVCGLLVIVCVAGCSGENPGTTIQGTVTFNDRPVFPGSVLAKQADGKILSANLTSEGKFTLAGVQTQTYEVAIQTQKLANIGRGNAPSKDNKQVKRREDKVPEKFKNANVDIPDRYRKWETSNLTWDFTSEIPTSTVEIVLKETK